MKTLKLEKDNKMNKESFGKYRLVNYFDVWGNEKDGYEVNNSSIEFDDLIILDNAKEKEILNYLVSIGFLTTSDRRKVRIVDNGDFLEIEAVKNNYPIGRLELIQD